MEQKYIKTTGQFMGMGIALIPLHDGYSNDLLEQRKESFKKWMDNAYVLWQQDMDKKSKEQLAELWGEQPPSIKVKIPSVWLAISLLGLILSLLSISLRFL